jgi:hypothetical protein
MKATWTSEKFTLTRVCRNSDKIDNKPKGKRPLGRPKRRREDNIRMDLRETEWEDVDWMHLAFSCENGNEPSGSKRNWGFLDQLSYC